MVFAIGFNLSTAVDSIQAATFKIKQQEIENDYKQFLLERDINYKISLRNNMTQLVITGELDIGITTAVKNILKQRPNVSTVALNSIGGHVYEGRGLSKLFTRQSLDTYVYHECSSACTTAFSGGVKRYIGTDGKLGFHQYKHDLSINKKAVNFHNAGAEQERDLEVFKSRGIKDHFLKKIFKESSNGMWFPSHKELIEAKVIDGVIETN